MKQSWKRQFAVIYTGQAFSILGSSVVQFAVIWWLTVQTESAVTLAIATLVAFIPNMIIGPFAGVWIDRYNRRTVMMLADGLIALSSAALGLAFMVMGTPPIWFIYAVLFVRGIGNTFHTPAMQAAIPSFVPAEMLTKAGGWGNLVSSASNMLGPVLGAALMAAFPVAGIMLVDIFGAMFAIVCLMFVRIPDIRQNTEAPHALSDMKQGFAAMRGNKPLMATFVPMLLFNILYMPMGSLFPLLILTHFNGTAWHTSAVEFVFAGGLLVSSLVIGVWGGLKRRFFQISLAMALLGLAAGVGGVLPADGFIVFLVCSFVMGSSGTFFNVPMMAYIQSTIAPDMMGKVFSLLLTAMTLAMPVGLLVAGPVSDWIGVDRLFLFSGAAIVLTSAYCWLATRRYDREAMATKPLQEKGNA